MEFAKLYFYFEVIGTIAFAISGTVVGIYKKMDIFGNWVLAIITSVGGGILRDLLLGITPPTSIKYPFSILIASITAFIFMFLFRFRKKLYKLKYRQLYKKMLIITDAIGLGIFTVVGINVAIMKGHVENTFLLVLVGVLTGVGGGVIRDMMAGSIPGIFTRNIYAVSSIVGALIYIYSRNILSYNYRILFGAFVIFMIRLISEKYDLHLPKVR